MTTTDLIRLLDDVELLCPGRWTIAARQPVVLLGASGLRRHRVAARTLGGALTIAADPLASTLDLIAAGARCGAGRPAR